MFFSIYISVSAKKCQELNSRNLRKYVSKNKIYFCLKKKSNVWNISNVFKLDSITHIICCIIHRCLYSLFILFCSLISVSKKQNIEKVLTLPYSYNWQKFNKKMNEKKMKPGGSEYGHPESYSGDSFETILLFDFCTALKILICFSLIKHFPNSHKRYFSCLQVSILHRVDPIKIYLKMYESLKSSYLKKVLDHE